MRLGAGHARGRKPVSRLAGVAKGQAKTRGGLDFALELPEAAGKLADIRARSRAFQEDRGGFISDAGWLFSQSAAKGDMS